MAGQLTKDQFASLNADERSKVLKSMKAKRELKIKFSELPPGERAEVLKTMKAVKENPDISMAESAAGGAVQAATLGFADEIMAGLSAGAKSLFTDKSFKEAYDEDVAEIRQRFRAQEATNPKTYTGAKIATDIGMTLTPLGLASKAGKAANIGKGLIKGVKGVAKGTGLAALAAAGESEKDITSKEFRSEVAEKAGKAGLAQTALNVAGPLGRAVVKAKPGTVIGAVTGGMAGGLPGAIGGALSSEVTKKVLKETLKNKNLISKSMRDKGSSLLKMVESGKKIPEKFETVLAEGLQKNGGMGLIAAHAQLSQDPDYQKFLKTKKED